MKKINDVSDLGFITKLLIANNINPVVLKRYNEPHRHYHTINHIHEMLLILQNENDLALNLAVIFHDIIYDPKMSDNEEKSAELFKELWKGDKKLSDEVCQIILETKTHNYTTPNSRKLLEADLGIFMQTTDKIIEYDKQIFKEYQFVDYKKYREARLDVLTKLKELAYTRFNKHLYDGIIFCIEHVKSFKPKIAVFTGSFNPFHIGHQNILEKAEQIFDKVIIARGINEEKKNEDFRMLPSHLNYHQQEMYHGLITDLLKELDYPITLVRGLRNAKDFEYETTMMQYIKDINNNIDIPTTLIVCDVEFRHISSSSIKQLPKHKQDFYLDFRPKPNPKN